MRIDLRQMLLDEVKRHPSERAAARHFGIHSNSLDRLRSDPKTNPALEPVQRALDDYLERHPPEDFDVSLGKVLILMPIWKSVEGKTFTSLTRALAHYGRDQVEVLTEFGTDIANARCRLADRAIALEAKWVIFIDSDAVVPCGNGMVMRAMGYNIPEPNASLNAIARLLSAPKEQRIVSALCFLRREPLVAACSTGLAGGFSASELVRLRNEPGETGTEPQEWVGMHFTRVDVDLFRGMREKCPEIAPKENGKPWGYFMKEHAGETEDGAFCLRAKKACGAISYLDTTLRVGHIIGGVI